MSTHRIGLVGAGGIAPVHVEGWQSLGLPITVFSRSGAEALAQGYGLEVATSLEELLEQADIVDVVTPTLAHDEVAIGALKAGKPTLCEKPLARTHDAAAHLAQLTRSTGSPLMPAHVVRFFPEYRRIKEAIDAGVVGTPAIIRLTRAGQRPDPDSWMMVEAESGGIIMDQMIHDLDQARWWAGEVTRVFATQNPPHPDAQTNHTVTAHVTLTHANGTISHIRGFWGPPGLEFHTSLSVAGSSGFLEYTFPHDGACAIDIPSQGGEVQTYPSDALRAESPYTTQIRHFYEALTHNRAFDVTADDAVVAVGLAEAALESVTSGQPVDFDESVLLTTSGGLR